MFKLKVKSLDRIIIEDTYDTYHIAYQRGLSITRKSWLLSFSVKEVKT